MTHKEMRDQVQRWLGLQDIENYNELDIIEAQLYQGTIDLLARTRCVVRCIDLRTEADVPEYTLDHALLTLVDVEDGLTRVPRSSALGPSFTLIRSDVLRLQPTPDEDGEVQVWGVRRPQKMTDDDHSVGDEPYGAIPDEFQDAIVTYALWKCADYSDDQSASQGERYRVLYEGQDGRGGRLAQIRIAVNKRGTARAPRRRVRLPGLNSASHWVG